MSSWMGMEDIKGKMDAKKRGKRSKGVQTNKAREWRKQDKGLGDEIEREKHEKVLSSCRWGNVLGKWKGVEIDSDTWQWNGEKQVENW